MLLVELLGGWERRVVWGNRLLLLMALSFLGYIYFFWLLAWPLCSVQVDEFWLTVHSVLVVCLCVNFWSVWLSASVHF